MVGQGMGVGTGRTVTRRQLARLGAGLALTPLLVSCDVPAFFEKAAEDRVLVQMMGDNRYDPATVTVPLGATVVWENQASLPHTATCLPADLQDPALAQHPPDAVGWDSGAVYTGETWSLTFLVAGTYVYSCRFHGQTGMVGLIVVAG